jgi:hypothetical protein
LHFANSNSILKVINNKDKDRSEEINGMHNRQREIELCRCKDDSMDDNNQISFKDVIEVNIILKVEG